MGDDPEEVLTPFSQPDRTIAPKARSLHIHGIFAKPATKIGIVATKASFILMNFIQKETPALHIPQTVDRLLGKQVPEPEAESSETTKKKNDADHLVRLVKHSQEVLARATTVFPFTLFPDNITIDRTKVTIHKRGFFFASDTVSIKIEDILNVSCGLGPIFGSISIVMVMNGGKYTVNFFWRKDAIYLKHVLQGAVIAHSNNLDTTELSREDLISTLVEIGHDANG